jgi:hypothetical protein
VSHEFQSNLRRWDVVAGLCQSIDAKTYVEVGCREGRTTGFVLAQCPDIRAIAIDPWCAQSPSEDVTRETYEKWDFKGIARQFWENVGGAPPATAKAALRQATNPWAYGRCVMLRMPSNEAAYGLGVGNSLYRHMQSIDVIFIDALHDYESVKQDISLWWPRVRPGGYLCGHDYNHKWPGVMRAVAEQFNLMDVCLGPDSMWWVQKAVKALQTNERITIPYADLGVTP